MKKEVAEFIQSLGAITSYSGKLKTMFIRFPKWHRKTNGMLTMTQIHNKVIQKFGYGLPFKLA